MSSPALPVECSDQTTNGSDWSDVSSGLPRRRDCVGAGDRFWRVCVRRYCWCWRFPERGIDRASTSAAPLTSSAATTTSPSESVRRARRHRATTRPREAGDPSPSTVRWETSQRVRSGRPGHVVEPEPRAWRGQATGIPRRPRHRPRRRLGLRAPRALGVSLRTGRRPRGRGTRRTAWPTGRCGCTRPGSRRL